jgi:hypothetical protein
MSRRETSPAGVFQVHSGGGQEVEQKAGQPSRLHTHPRPLAVATSSITMKKLANFFFTEWPRSEGTSFFVGD